MKRHWRLLLGLILLSLFASHAVTGLLWSLGWFQLIGIEFEAWYLDRTYLIVSWVATGIALVILVPMLVKAIRGAQDGGRVGCK